MLAGRARGIVGLTLVVAGLVGGCQESSGTGSDGRAAEPHRPRFVPPPADEEVRALLAPWKVGTEVQGYKIAAIYGVVDGSIWVLFRSGQAVVHLEIVRSGEGPLPPFSAPPYFIYVSARGGAHEGLVSLAESAGAVLAANHTRPVPSELRTFHRGGDLPDLP